MVSQKVFIVSLWRQQCSERLLSLPWTSWLPTDYCNQHLMESKVKNGHLRHVIVLELLRSATPGLPPNLLHWNPIRNTLYMSSLVTFPGCGYCLIYSVTSWPSNVCKSGSITKLGEHMCKLCSGIWCWLSHRSSAVNHPATSCTICSGTIAPWITLIMN